MTNQEMFDKVATHLLTQGKQARDNDGDCMYRTPDGLKCAIGCLIPDDKYRADFEHADAGTTCIMQAAGLTNHQAHLAQALQHVHDGIPPQRWRERLAIVAAEHGLSAAVVGA